MLLNVYSVPVAMDDEEVVVAVDTVEACCELPDDLPCVLFGKNCPDPSSWLVWEEAPCGAGSRSTSTIRQQTEREATELVIVLV